jgi:hypothetical protein
MAGMNAGDQWSLAPKDCTGIDCESFHSARQQTNILLLLRRKLIQTTSTGNQIRKKRN